MSRSSRRPFDGRSRSRRPDLTSGLRLVATGEHEDEPVVLELVEFEIIDEPMDDPLMDRLRRQDHDRIMDAGTKVLEGATDQVSNLERLVEEFPNVPKVYNFLSVAYLNAGQHDKAEEWSEKTYRQFPHYLFGMVNYAHTLLQRGLVRQVGEILKGRFSLHLWIRNRRRYHVSEFVAFNGLMARYLAALGDRETSQRYYKMLREVAPDHPGTREIGRCLHPGITRSLMRRIAGWSSRARFGKAIEVNS